MFLNHHLRSFEYLGTSSEASHSRGGELGGELARAEAVLTAGWAETSSGQMRTVASASGSGASWAELWVDEGGLGDLVPEQGGRGGRMAQNPNTRLSSPEEDPVNMLLQSHI